MSGARITILPNVEGATGGKLVAVPATFDEFLAIASTKLELSAKRVFTSTGAEVDDVAVLRNDDTVYVSQGEPFFKSSKAPATANQSKALVKTYKMAVLGSGAVGKSNITLRFVKSIFIREYDPTIEDAYSQPLLVDGVVSQLSILDTAGQDEFSALFPTWVRGKDGFFLVYSVDRRESFDKVQVLYDMLMNYVPDAERPPPIVLLANKIDLPDEEQRVSYDDGYRLAAKWGVPFFQTSAKSGQNITEAFERALRDMRAAQGNTEIAVKEANEDKKGKKKWCSIL